MKEIVIISGKGGTGKTSITASFATLSSKAVFADCDVDAADLYLLFSLDTIRDEKFYSGTIPVINQSDCTQCGQCYSLCRYGAIENKLIHPSETKGYVVNPLACEGCGVCIDQCPVHAIKEEDRLCGTFYFSKTPFGYLSHAKLLPGGENSGKLVSAVRKQAQEFAKENQLDWVLIDGSPGIGCTVIASITGADRVLMVAEPTKSGMHDLERVFRLCKHFQIPIYVCVNKSDLNEENTEWIKNYTLENNENWVGTIPYDNAVTEAQILGKAVVAMENSPAADSIRSIWQKLTKI